MAALSPAHIVDLLEQHGVRDSVFEVVLWEHPKRSLLFLLGGITLFVLVHIAGIGMLTVIGTVAILQLFLYRFCQALQSKNILISQEVNLRDTLVWTPEASTISTAVELGGDVLRLIEEEIKEISLTGDLVRLVGAVVFLLICAVVGKFVSLPTLLVLAHVTAFTAPLLYLKFQAQIDPLIENANDQLDKVLSKLRKPKEE